MHDVLQQERAEALASMPTWLPQALAARGVPFNLSTATWAGVTPELRRKVDPLMDRLQDGTGTGWGLMGGAGIGKSGTMAAACRHWAEDRARRLIQVDPAHRWMKGWLPLWIHWPTALDDLRDALGDRLRHDDPARAWAEAPLLVLDDLGGERAKEDRDASWPVEKLFTLAEARFAARLPTLWTSNLGPEELVARYRPNVMSRLCGLAPWVACPRLPDRRAALNIEK